MSDQIIRAETPEQIDEVRRLFREYEAALGVDLCFQGFEDELKGLPGTYAPPGGVLLVALVEGRAVGCVALRDLGNGSCEMKRLFVRPPYRGLGLGRCLALAVIREARNIGYGLMRLDTLSTLAVAVHLYESLGFRLIPPYYDNPLPGVVYWELPLAGPRPG